MSQTSSEECFGTLVYEYERYKNSVPDIYGWNGSVPYRAHLQPERIKYFQYLPGRLDVQKNRFVPNKYYWSGEIQ